jgi:para-nitrobenzyl esterase
MAASSMLEVYYQTTMKVAIMAAALALAGGCASLAPQEPASLAGTSWQFVKFTGGDGKVLIPDDKSKYTVSFGADGRFNVRFDCNRGFGGWKSAAKNQIEFGTMGLTRAMCGPESLHDHFVRQWPHVRSYVVRNGNLHLALMADGGIFEFEPVP